MSGLRAHRLMLILVALTFALSACTSDKNDTVTQNVVEGATLAELGLEPGDNMTLDQVHRRVLAEVDTYQWPENYVVDIAWRFESVPAGSKNDRFQFGYEFTMLSHANACAWALSWQDARARGNPDDERAALVMLRDVIPNNPNMEGVSEHLRGIAEDAALGDASGINTFVRLNCEGIQWMTAPATPPAARHRDSVDALVPFAWSVTR